MWKAFKKEYLLFITTALFLVVNATFIYNDNYYFNLLPLVLIVVYFGIFHTQKLFLTMVLFVPLSINLEEYTHGQVGLFLPSEPILFGLMLWVIIKELNHATLDSQFWKHPIVLSLGFYLFWVFLTAITSTHPIVSFKFLLMKSWYIIPILLIGTKLFSEQKNVKKFLWCYALGMTVAIIYTLIRHAGYSFGEKEGHWVMSPLFKDHTIYGASVAINLLFIVGLLVSKTHKIQTQLILISLLIITAIGLYFSYTRAAWLSVVFALGVWFLIKYRIKFKYLLVIGLILSFVAYSSWAQIQIQLDKNKHEHTTENFEKRLQSAANISTDASNLERLNRWSAAWEMFKAKPILGFGPATYAFEYAPYQAPERLTIISTNFGDGGNAHSEYLGALAEMGLFGLLSVLLFVATLFYSGINLLKHLKRFTPEDKETYILILYILLAMSTYFFHGLLNNYLDTDKAAIPVYGAAAIIIAQQIQFRKRINLGKGYKNSQFQ